ncbi:FtsX-like permease family protein [Listeria sp. PSOL-1]|uniref:FtsX-like permease family protein n=1 Tax=Listeria sp. PSOL-1 TaxID=1844999 RepID=UPI0013D46F73|nr:ABC transporter permease [Listeria sp. PSOL-1]
MTLFKIAMRNLRKNFTQYLLYFVSVAICVLVIFIFMAIAYNQLIKKIFYSWIESTDSLFLVSSFFLIVFIAFFVFYSSAYFMTRRKREIGLYSLLGLRRGQICLVLFYENLFLHISALIVGILGGIFFSKFFMMLLFWVVDLHKKTYFMVSAKAILITTMTFLAIMCLVSLYGIFFVFRYKLVILLQKKKLEKKILKGSFWVMIIGIFLIAFGYYWALQLVNIVEKISSNEIMLISLSILTCVVLGTWFVIRFGLPFIFRIILQRRMAYYHGVNMLVLNVLGDRIKKSVNTLALTATFSAIALTIIGVTSCMYQPAIDEAKITTPVSFQILNASKKEKQEITKILKKQKAHPLVYTTETEYVLSELKKFNRDKEGVSPILMDPVGLCFISENEFNRLNELEGNKNKPITGLADKETVIVSYGVKRYEDVREDKVLTNLNLKNGSSFKTIDYRNRPILNVWGASETMFVVNEKTYRSLKQIDKTRQLSLYQVKDQQNSEALTRNIQILIDGREDLWSERVSSFFTDYHLHLISSGIMLYISIFFVNIFFLAIGSIIYFKQIIEAYDEQGKFHVLFKLGLTYQELKKIIIVQLIPMFVLPIFVGIVHSFVAALSYGKLMDVQVHIPIGIIFTFYCLFYGCYYWLCVNNYIKIVMRNHT